MSNWRKMVVGSSNWWIAICAVLWLFLVEGHNGFSLKDEGFLWYGSQRILEGEVPIRDFFSYDPGRYYLVASVMYMLGNNGIIAMRIALAIIQVIGLIAGLWALFRKDWMPGLWNLIMKSGVAVFLVIWMLPRHKMVDISISLVLVALLTWLLERPDFRRFFFAGLAVGLLAFFGRNHGVYGVLGFILATFWLVYEEKDIKKGIQRIFNFSCGVLLGYLPMILMILFVPGFWEAFWLKLIRLFETGGNNIHKAVTWPWDYSISYLLTMKGIREGIIGVFYGLLIVFPVVFLGYLFWKRRKRLSFSPTFLAGTMFIVPYMHHAFSRGEFGHLAQGIFPFWVAVLSLVVSLRTPWRGVILFLLAGITIVFIYPKHPLHLKKGQIVDIQGDKLFVSKKVAGEIAFLKKLQKTYAPSGQNIVVLPYWPGAYSLLGKKSPNNEIFIFYRMSKKYQAEEIAKIKKAKPGFILIDTWKIDNVFERSFMYNCPDILKYFELNYQEISVPDRNGFRLFIPKG